MWRLEYPWLLLLAPLAFAAWRYLPAYVNAQGALRVPFFPELLRATGLRPGRPRGHGLQRWLNLLVWLLLVLALARPQFVEPPTTRERPLRDLMVAIDLSQSMEATDFKDPQGRVQSRLDAVKDVVAGFLRQRADDRLGLIVFGSGAYPQAPPTLDHATLQRLLAQVEPGMAGPHTAIGDAIGLGIRLLDAAPGPDKLLILLTDGNDTASVVPPDRAAALAAAHHITIHTIGIGDPQASGEDKVDFDALRAIAAATHGRFYAAADRGALAQVYAELDRITPRAVQVLRHQVQHEFYWVPLGLALLLLAAGQGLAYLLAGRAPARARGEEGAWTST
ncbi:hypothetical protein CEG14_10755 [Bordetella genomosp. 1]|uniref:VWFA domain-containing protein n=1 Tax=Bordetella genomosp. 1 TaxID=1395607 RepID=A0A261SDR1_9BORD|nr:VWA domain-containing protein [Bordetella genomosp. 1]OZI35548.1 hypothetical protein CEG14_10755 [Bordetella genomosp. 1]